MTSNRMNVILAVYVEPLEEVFRSPWIFGEWRVYILPENKHT